MGISLEKPCVSVTFHPVTLEKNSAIQQVTELAEVLKEYKDLNFIVTMANADLQGGEINKSFSESMQIAIRISFAIRLWESDVILVY